MVTGVLERIGVDIAAARRRVDDELGKLARVTGATVRDAQLAAEAFRLLEAADAERTQLDDEYLSTEHMLLAMSAVPGRRRRRAAFAGHHARRCARRVEAGARVAPRHE